jgi:2-hydroxychromene-2-carboxylate isomerase
VRAVYAANFAHDLDIADPEVLAGILEAMELEAAPILARAGSPDVKARLRAQTERAAELGLFGSPSFVVGGELFWGNDRLGDAMAWARLGPEAGRSA